MNIDYMNNTVYGSEYRAREGGAYRGGYAGAGYGMSNSDKMFLESVVRRQEIAMKDIFLLADRYPGLIPSEALGGLYAINTLLQDCKESAIRR